MIRKMFDKFRATARSVMQKPAHRLAPKEAKKTLSTTSGRPKWGYRYGRFFRYLGTDGKTHTARIGKPFPVRPEGEPYMILATVNNRKLVEVR